MWGQFVVRLEDPPVFVDDPAKWWKLLVVGGREWYPTSWGFLFVS